jgi:hypothetical protein
MLRRKYTPSPRVPAVPLPKPPNYATNLHRVAEVPKEPIFRSRPYRMYVARQECFACKLVGFSQAAHENMDKGMAMKVCDTRLFPLCTSHFGSIGCHEEYDLGLDGLTREARRSWARLMVARMLARAVSEGWRFTEEGIEAP